MKEAAEYYEKALRLIERDFGKTEQYRMMERNLEKVKGM